MPQFDYIIIGGGMTADAAVRGIRRLDGRGSIALFTEEKHPPYNRPPLSKALWKGDPLESIWRKTPGEALTVRLSTTVTALDVAQKTVRTSGGETHTYRRLLLATGGRPRTIRGAPEGIIYYRTLDDYLMLRTLIGKGKKFAVIGGGFIGSEVAAALAMNGESVTMLLPERGIGARLYPVALSSFLNSYFAERGVRVMPGSTVTGIMRKGETYTVSTASGVSLDFDAVVAGIGIEPNIELARDAGIHVGNGIEVDDRLQTSAENVYAAGDVACIYNPAVDGMLRVEHEDSALAMGESAGRSMAGEDIRYHHLPFFYSDLFELGYEAVGELDARLRIVEDWRDPFRKGVVYYMKDDLVRGVLLWNTWGKVDAARNLIAEHVPFEDRNLRGRITDD